jgi:hypothetical protein
MNTKILNLVQKNLQKAFSLAKYNGLGEKIAYHTKIENLPWTPARFTKFRSEISQELDLECPQQGTVEQIVHQLDTLYSRRFFGEIWKPRTDDYNYTGWSLVDEINSQNPTNVLDVGCGYHPFKGRIPNLIGIDPFNNCADFMVDILEYKTYEPHDHIIALGSINFNSKSDIERRFGHCVEMLAPGGQFYIRANPGIAHLNGPYIDIFPWSFAIVKEFEIKWNLKLETFKRDNNDRLYFRYSKAKNLQ